MKHSAAVPDQHEHGSIKEIYLDGDKRIGWQPGRGISLTARTDRSVMPI
jgi:hypothetical protein